jgi:protein-L-isoaspartate O-methyltransferase
MSSSVSVPPLSVITRHEVAVYPAMAMLAGMKLDVFTPLRDGPLTGTEIAGAIGVDPAKLVPLLYALVAADLLTVQGDRFSNTPEADIYLVKGRGTYMAGSRQLFYADIWQALLKTADTIRAGAPQHRHSFYDMSEDEMVTFFRGQHYNAVAVGEQLARVYDLSPFQHMLDVGTGSGGVSIGVVRSGADLRITALDLPKVIPVTRRFLEEEGAASRVATLVGDMIAGAPEGTYDVAVLRALIQVLSLADAQEVVRHVAQSLAQNGTILIIGAMMEDNRLTPPNYVGQNLVFLNIYDDGLIYTEGEYRGLLLAAGFTDIMIRRGEMPTGQVLISARKLG